MRTTATGIKARSRHGFTLVEMLVVIAVIAILASLLFPALRNALRTARAIHCVNNIKVIFQGESLYEADYNAVAYDYSAGAASGMDFIEVHRWGGLPMYPYLGITVPENATATEARKNSVYYCPGVSMSKRSSWEHNSSYPRSARQWLAVAGTAATYGNYTQRAVRSTQVPQPSQTVFHFEGTGAWGSSAQPHFNYGVASYFNYWNSFHDGNNALTATYRLSDRRTILFWDGHAEAPAKLEGDAGITIGDYMFK